MNITSGTYNYYILLGTLIFCFLSVASAVYGFFNEPEDRKSYLFQIGCWLFTTIIWFMIYIDYIDKLI